MMSIEINKSSRATFLRKLSLAVASVFGLTFTGLNVRKTGNTPPGLSHPLSQEQANELIRHMNSPMPDLIKPERPPKDAKINFK